MYADFSDDAFAALQSGEAVDNNGFRSKKGNFYPDQPVFSPMDDRKEKLQDAGVELLIAAGGYVVFQVVLPEVKRFTHEKVYPFVSEKWDEWQEKRCNKRAVKHAQVEVAQTDKPISMANSSEKRKTSVPPKVIRIEDYRKMAL